jgi:hypothetical protein
MLLPSSEQRGSRKQVPPKRLCLSTSVHSDTYLKTGILCPLQKQFQFSPSSTLTTLNLNVINIRLLGMEWRVFQLLFIRLHGVTSRTTAILALIPA